MLNSQNRVSTDDLDTPLRREVLTAARCVRVFSDPMSGAKAERPGLRDAANHCRAGMRMMWQLDRLGRSLPNLIELMMSLDEKTIVALDSFATGC